MKKSLFIWLIIVFWGLVFLRASSQNASAHFSGEFNGIRQNAIEQLAAKTPLPTAPPVSQGYPTPESRVLPPVGNNAGLVIGASVLVLIIIGGVLAARRKPKHWQG
jgi:hypothetical protein